MTRLVFVLLCALGCLCVSASPLFAVEGGDTKIGMYLTDLHHFDFENDTFSADIWLWFIYPNDKESSPMDTYEVINGVYVENSLDFTDVRDAQFWSTRKIKGTYRFNWNLKNYPWDKHTLKIILEEADLETSDLYYIVDSANVGVAPDLAIEGWTISRCFLETLPYTYKTSFGDPDSAGGSSYSRAVLNIEIKRDSMSSFVKLHAVIFIAFVISLCALRIKPKSGDYFAARCGMIVAMVYATVLNLQFVDQNMGSPSSLTLTDLIHFTTLGIMMLFFVLSIASYVAMEKGACKVSEKIDIVAIVCGIPVYTAVLLALNYFYSV